MEHDVLSRESSGGAARPSPRLNGSVLSVSAHSDRLAESHNLSQINLGMATSRDQKLLALENAQLRRELRALTELQQQHDGAAAALESQQALTSPVTTLHCELRDAESSLDVERLRSVQLAKEMDALSEEEIWLRREIESARMARNAAQSILFGLQHERDEAQKGLVPLSDRASSCAALTDAALAKRRAVERELPELQKEAGRLRQQFNAFEAVADEKRETLTRLCDEQRQLESVVAAQEEFVKAVSRRIQRVTQETDDVEMQLQDVFPPGVVGGKDAVKKLMDNHLRILRDLVSRKCPPQHVDDSASSDR